MEKNKVNVRIINEIYKINEEERQIILESLEWMFGNLNYKHLEGDNIKKVDKSIILLRNLKQS